MTILEQLTAWSQARLNKLVELKAPNLVIDQAKAELYRYKAGALHIIGIEQWGNNEIQGEPFDLLEGCGVDQIGLGYVYLFETHRPGFSTDICPVLLFIEELETGLAVTRLTRLYWGV